MQTVKKGEAKVAYQLKNGWRLRRHQMETPKGESLTVPDESYTIRDLIRKYSAGLDPKLTLLSEWSGEENEVEHDDYDLRSVGRVDRTELDEVGRENSARQARLLEQMEASKKRKKTAPGSQKYEDMDEADDLRNEDEDNEEIPESDREPGQAKRGKTPPKKNASPS